MTVTKRKQGRMGDIATDYDIKCLWSFVDMIDSSLSMSNTTKKDISKSSKFFEFVDSHCRVRPYVFQVKKCEDRNCCPPPRLSSEVFSSVHWLPDPTLKQDKSHFKTLEELHGQDTTGIDCPSTALQRGKGPEPSTFFTAVKVRAIAHCLACDKPRRIYSEKLSTYIEKKNCRPCHLEQLLYNVVHLCYQT